jgi:hypothetical protein
MADFTVRADHIDVEQIMRQIRARIRDKRGADYTEAEIRELASVKLDKFLDPRAVRSNLLQHYRSERQPAPLITPDEAHPPLWDFNPQTVYASDRGAAGRILTIIRKILKPFSKLLFHVDTLWDVLTKQSVLNRQHTALFQRVHQRLITRDELDALNFEMFNNLVVEITRLGIENKNLRMQVESFGTRLDFDERRARALEGVVQYRPGAPVARPPQPAQPSQPSPTSQPSEEGGDDDEATEGGDGRSARRRRRRRGRRRGGEGGEQGPREQGGREQGQREQGPREQHEREQGGPESSSGSSASSYAAPAAEAQSYEQHEQHESHQQDEQAHAIEQAHGGEPAGEPHYHSYAEPPVAHAPTEASAWQDAEPDQPAADHQALDHQQPGQYEPEQQVPESQVPESQAAPSWEQPAPTPDAPASEPHQPYEPTPSDRPAPQRIFDAPRRSDSDSGEPGSSQS